VSKLIVDITQLVNWQGKLTGIPRVMDEIASRYAVSENDPHFVAWSAPLGGFEPVDLKVSMGRRQTTVIPQVASPEVGHTDSYSLVHRALRKGKRLAAGASRRVGIYEYANRVAGPYLRLQSSFETPRSLVTPAHGDTLLILWGEWADDTYIRRIVELKANGVLLAQVSYDMLPAVTPQYSGHSTAPFIRYNREILPICDLVLSISEHTRQDIKVWLGEQGLKVPRIEVIRLGDTLTNKHAIQPQDPSFDSAGLMGGDYILCVGTIEARKNHALLYYVYKLAKERGIKLPKLIIVGRRGWLTENIFELITTDPDTANKIIPLLETSDDELTWLYRHCSFTVYPSFYEGWGLPIAESVAHGVPCISSNTSSMPEIAGSLIDYFSPASTEECLGAIMGLTDPSKLADAKRRVRQYKITLWDETFITVERLIGELKNAN